MEEVVVVSGVRTAVGTFGGMFKDVAATDLGAAVIKATLEQAGIEGSQVEEVIFGSAGQVAELNYVARVSAVKAGLPVDVPAFNVNRLCGSGLQAINSAAQEIQTGYSEIVVAGGAENMSQFPYLSRKTRWGSRMGHIEMEDGLIGALNCPFNHYHMGVTAENLAEKYSISRAEQDEFALRSHQRAIAAIDAGRFKDQIVPIRVPQPKGEPKVADTDEHPRRDTSLERLAKLGPAFKPNGTVTAGNASGLNDAAAAVLMMSASKARALGLKPRVRVVSMAAAGVEPSIMGIGPVSATRRALRSAGLTLDDMDVIELNEAFAAQAIAVDRELKVDWDKTNPNGGAVALGHPVGATGAILVVKIMNELERVRARYGLVTLCIGGGQGIATIFERLDN